MGWFFPLPPTRWVRSAPPVFRPHVGRGHSDSNSELGGPLPQEAHTNPFSPSILIPPIPLQKKSCTSYNISTSEATWKGAGIPPFLWEPAVSQRSRLRQSAARRSAKDWRLETREERRESRDQRLEIRDWRPKTRDQRREIKG